MGLSKFEKLHLLMTCDIYEKLGITDSFNPEIVRDAITSGNTWVLDYAYGMVLNNPEVETDKVDFVCKVLDMYRALRQSYEKLSKDDQSKININDLNFPGFDGNEEVDHISIVHTLFNIGRYPDFKDHSANSHIPMIETYTRMLRKYSPIKSNALSADHILSIIESDNY